MTLTTEETVFQTIANRLRTSAALTYVKNVYEGERQVSLDSQVPCLILEPEPYDEEWVELPKRRQVIFAIKIIGVLDIRNRLDKQIVGDDVQVGSLRFINDILKAFEGSDITLGNNVQSYELKVVDNRNIENSKREVQIRLELKLKFFTAEQRT